jgi:uncharacterized protein (UPF0261 family)
VSALDADGMAFRDEAADTALFDAVLAAVDGSAVTVVDTDAHINDKELAVAAADLLHDLITGPIDRQGVA